MSGPYERSDRDAEIVLQCQSKWLYQYIFTARKLVVMQDLLLPSHSQRSHDHLMTRQQSQHWWSMGWEMGGNIDNLHSIIARVAIWNCCSLLYIERSMFNISGCCLHSRIWPDQQTPSCGRVLFWRNRRCHTDQWAMQHWFILYKYRRWRRQSICIPYRWQL